MDYRGLNVIAFVMIFLWVPETKQRTLEELDYICQYLHQCEAGSSANAWNSRRAYKATHAVSGHGSSSLGFQVLPAPADGRITAALQVPEKSLRSSSSEMDNHRVWRTFFRKRTAPLFLSVLELDTPTSG